MRTYYVLAVASAVALLTLATDSGIGDVAAATETHALGKPIQVPADVLPERNRMDPAMFARLQRGDIKRRVRQITSAERSQAADVRRADMHRMVASASHGASRYGGDMLISNETGRWDQKRFELDLAEEARSGWETDTDGYKSYSRTTRRSAPSRPGTTATTNSKGTERAVKSQDEGEAISLLASVPSWVKYSIVAAPAVMGLLGFIVYMLVRWRHRRAEGRRSHEPALLMGLVEPQRPARTATLAKIGQQHGAQPAHLALENEKKRRAA
jgi:hypothetical protein